MAENEKHPTPFETNAAELIRQDALRRAADERSTTSGPGLEDVLARISAEVTADAVENNERLALEEKKRATGTSPQAKP